MTKKYIEKLLDFSANYTCSVISTGTGKNDSRMRRKILPDVSLQMQILELELQCEVVLPLMLK